MRWPSFPYARTALFSALLGLGGCDGCNRNASDSQTLSTNGAKDLERLASASSPGARVMPNSNGSLHERKAAEKRLGQDLASDAVHRITTPGTVRFSLELDAPVGRIEKTTLGGLGVSSGKYVHTVTSQGHSRWRHNVGAGHQLYRIGEAQVAWSPQYHQLVELKKRGRTGWTRSWKGAVESDGEGGLYLIDASTVSKLGPKGKDLWRAIPSGIRHLEGPYPCHKGTLFHGIRGLSRLAIRVSERGAVIRETPLERGAVMLGAAPGCVPLVWSSAEVSLVTENGGTAWSFSLPTQPFVKKLAGGWALVTPRGDSPATFAAVSDRGEAIEVIDLPVSGRLTAVQVLVDPSAPDRVAGLALCRDVTSPCARPENLRGPYDALLVVHDNQRVTPLLRHVPGHLNVTNVPRGYVIASSGSPDVTDVTFRDHSWDVVWTRTIPGRLSAGPAVGTGDDVYVATCAGWECGPPYRLFSLTLSGPEGEPAHESALPDHQARGT